jgi:hypothetical protein
MTTQQRTTITARIAVRSSRGQDTVVEEHTSELREQLLSGEWTEWSVTRKGYRHDGVHVNLREDGTFENVRNGMTFKRR